MSFFGFLSSPDSQNFALSRRGLLGKSLAIGVLSLLPKPQIKSSYPSPEFKIGDFVAYDWEPDEYDDDDEVPDSATDFGEVLGMRWVPKPDGYSSGISTWVYFVRWTHSTCPNILPEPSYDGEPTESSDLRLVSAEEVCKR
jgi:hypothetical protein